MKKGTKIVASVETVFYSQYPIENDQQAIGYIKSVMASDEWELLNTVVFSREEWDSEEIDEKTIIDPEWDDDEE